MAEKISKTARASLGAKGSAGAAQVCPTCGSQLVATRVVRSPEFPGGMYWVCQKDDYRAKIR